MSGETQHVPDDIFYDVLELLASNSPDGVSLFGNNNQQGPYSNDHGGIDANFGTTMSLQSQQLSETSETNGQGRFSRPLVSSWAVEENQRQPLYPNGTVSEPVGRPVRESASGINSRREKASVLPKNQQSEANERKKAKNRASAKKSREKEKRGKAALKQQNKTLIQENKTLKLVKKDLKKKLLTLERGIARIRESCRAGILQNALYITEGPGGSYLQWIPNQGHQEAYPLTGQYGFNDHSATFFEGADLIRPDQENQTNDFLDQFMNLEKSLNALPCVNDSYMASDDPSVNERNYTMDTGGGTSSHESNLYPNRHELQTDDERPQDSPWRQNSANGHSSLSMGLENANVVSVYPKMFAPNVSNTTRVDSVNVWGVADCDNFDEEAKEAVKGL